MNKLQWLLPSLLILQLPYVYGMDEKKASQHNAVNNTEETPKQRQQSIPNNLKKILTKIQTATHTRFTRLHSPQPARSPSPINTQDHLEQCETHNTTITEANE